MTDQIILYYFQKSTTLKFYKFLKTRQAKSIVYFSPQNNPNSFTFFLKDLTSTVFKQRQNAFIHDLKREGLKVEHKQIGIWKVSHRDLTLQSTLNQLMQVWYKNTVKYFLSTKCSQVYRALNIQYSKMQSSQPKKVRWSKDGKFIIIKKAKYREFDIAIKCFHFKLKRDTLKHEFLRQSSPLYSIDLYRIQWLGYYLIYFEKKMCAQKFLFLKQKINILVKMLETGCLKISPELKKAFDISQDLQKMTPNTLCKIQTKQYEQD